MHDARSITSALRGKWQGSYGLCRCPVHVDRTPSLKVKDDWRKDDGIDVCCFAGCDWRDVKAALVGQHLLPEFRSNVPLPPLRLELEPDVEDDVARTGFALKIWDVAGPLRCSLGFQYFMVRELPIEQLDLDHVLRFHEGFTAVVALMTDPVMNKPRGVHRTFLNPDATKREKKMLGRQGVIRLGPDEDVLGGLGICEGIETGLRILLSGWSPVWCATSAGGIARFPVLSGIESLTIFTDDDEAGMNAAHDCAERWTAADREVRLAYAKDSLDGGI